MKTKTRGNGQGSVYQMPNKKWRVVLTLSCYIDEDGKMHRTIRQKKGLRTKTEALDALQKLKEERNEYQYTPEKTTLKALYDAWIPTHEAAKQTISCYKSAFVVFRPLWNASMRDVSVDGLQACMDKSGKGRRTLENAKTALSLVYKYGAPRGAVPQNPSGEYNLSKFLKVKSETKSVKKPGFNDEQLAKIEALACDGVLTAKMVFCHCYLGLRPSAFINLTTSNYDAEHNAFVAGIKTEAGIDRAVTISPKIQPYIDEFIRNAKDGKLFDVNVRGYRTAFYSLCEKIGATEKKPDGKRLYTPHSCRHTFATLIKRVQAPTTDKLSIIGHTSEMMLKEYQDISWNDLHAITDSM